MFGIMNVLDVEGGGRGVGYVCVCVCVCVSDGMKCGG